MSAISPTQSAGQTFGASENTYWSQDLTSRVFGPTEVLLRPGSATRPGIWNQFAQGLTRRWRRERRRRKVGRAYDMATEIARSIPYGSRVLDVGCGNGYVAHHLGALLGVGVFGIDLGPTSDAKIAYRQFDGKAFPVADAAFDVALFCYVLHHAQDIKVILREVHRSLRPGGSVVIYEDIPETAWDRIACAIHDRKWRGRTGPCTFRGEREWLNTFASEGLELISSRRLSRWRNLFHPVRRRVFLLRLVTAVTVCEL